MPMLISAKGKRFMGMGQLAKGFASRVAAYEDEAAKAATDASRVIYDRWHSGRPLVPQRKGRATTGGQFANLLSWSRNGQGLIEFDMAALAAATPTAGGNLSYALIQEIGTGQSARLLNMGGTGYTVPSQVGRTISPHLYWADGEGGSLSRPLSGKNRMAQQKLGSIGMQNLYVRPDGQFGRAGRIRREIKGKHFIRDGGLTGYDYLRQQLVKDFRSTFKQFASVR